MKVNGLVAKLKQSKLFKDSFWAIFGNGLGTALLLIAGIIIARYLGKDVYGEYGVVKTNMFYIAGFSTFGLGLTSTRFIAKYLGEDRTQIIGIYHSVRRLHERCQRRRAAGPARRGRRPYRRGLPEACRLCCHCRSRHQRLSHG